MGFVKSIYCENEEGSGRLGKVQIVCSDLSGLGAFLTAYDCALREVS